MSFINRAEAGRQLALRLEHLCGGGVLVLGIPGGGVPVAAQVARALQAPLDVVVIDRLGVPFQPERTLGAVGEDGIRLIDEAAVRRAGVSDNELAALEARECAKVEARAARLRGSFPHRSLAGRVVVLIDDGAVTGASMLAACRAAYSRGAQRVVVGLPVAPPEAITRLESVADEVVCLHPTPGLVAVGERYAEFDPVSDDDVRDYLAATRPAEPPPEPPSELSQCPVRDETVLIEAGEATLTARCLVPAGAVGLVVFAHGSGSSRHSPRNRYVAAALQRAGFGTLLSDLLTTEEELDRVNVYDIPLLTARLSTVTGWLRRQPEAHRLRIGYFGSDSGAAAALRAASEPGADVAAIVSRGGRPDLAYCYLQAVGAPTLLIVGEHDDRVLELTRIAQAQLRCEHELVIVHNAGHVFAEPGALDRVAELAGDWFLRWLPAVGGEGGGQRRSGPLPRPGRVVSQARRRPPSRQRDETPSDARQ